MTGRDRQTVADVALTAAGSAEAMFLLARRNGIALDACVAGKEVEGVGIIDKRVVEHYVRNSIVPANGLLVSPSSVEESAEDDSSEDDVSATDDTTDVHATNG